MVMASDALRDMQGASTELSHSVKEVEQTKGDGICRAKPDKQTHKGICDFNRDDEYVCKSQYLFCDWVPAKVIPAHCEGRPEHPAHSSVLQKKMALIPKESEALPSVCGLLCFVCCFILLHDPKWGRQ